MPDPCSPEAFEARYASDPDPWQFATADYERRRYASLLATLARARYRSAYEPACSIGELTVRLGDRCDRLRAVDVSSTAVAAAQARCRNIESVTVELGSVADEVDLDFDLIVFSEVGYYFGISALDSVIGLLVAALVPGGEFVACHWTGQSDDHRLSGQLVHERIGLNNDLDRISGREHEGFVLESWRRR